MPLSKTPAFTRPFALLAALAVTGAVTLLLPATAQAQDGSAPGSLGVELNKTETLPDGGGCRAYFLFRNETGKSFEGFEMSLAVLDGEGVIDRLLSIDAAPLPVARTTLKLFDIPDLACDNISEILLHDMTACRPQNEAETDCFALLTLGSRTAAKLVK